MNISILGMNIKKIREEKGISAYKLCKLANVGGATISEIESGERQSLRSDSIKKIADALGVTTDDLFETEEGKEYVVTDIEQTINLVLSSDELVLDDKELTPIEKNQIEMAIQIALNNIRELRKNK
jgi:transcriptional regulator with XRE-family HTH domain